MRAAVENCRRPSAKPRRGVVLRGKDNDTSSMVVRLLELTCSTRKSGVVLRWAAAAVKPGQHREVPENIFRRKTGGFRLFPPGARLRSIVSGPVLRLEKYRLPEWQTVLHLATPSVRHVVGPRPQHYGGRLRMRQRTDARRWIETCMPLTCVLFPRLPTPSPTLCVFRSKVMPVGPIAEDPMSAEVGQLPQSRGGRGWPVTDHSIIWGFPGQNV